jgi:hypothetical protein
MSIKKVVEMNKHVSLSCLNVTDNEKNTLNGQNTLAFFTQESLTVKDTLNGQTR